MTCCFVPVAFFQSIADDESISEGARQEAQNQADSISKTIAAIDAKVKTRDSEIPDGFSAKIWGMAARDFEAIDRDTGEVLSSSYAPLPSTFYTSSDDPHSYKEDPDVNTCMEGLLTTHSFYKTVFRRNSVDDQGLQLMVLGNSDGNSRFGRFAGIFKPGSMVASLDIIAHELTHGMTQHTAKLKYELQSGALNESISDVFASTVVQWSRDQTVHEVNWLIGANIINPNSESLKGSKREATSLRSMKDPSAKTNLDPQPDSMKHKLYYRGDNSWDYGGVHRNSGVPNFAFYEVAMALGAA